MVLAPVPCDPCCSRPLLVVIAIDELVGEVFRAEVLAYVSSVGIQKQLGAQRNFPSRVAQTKVVSSSIEIIYGVGWIVAADVGMPFKEI